ncbi:MAG: fumarylacetoacetase [Acidobacteriaceae bacterium]
MDLMQSWVEGANGADFPLENLPLGVFLRADGQACIGSAIGDSILDLRAASDAGLLTPDLAAACREDSLNALMGLGREASRALRQRLQELFSDPSAQKSVDPLLVNRAQARMLLPARIGDYTDFYASIYHATNVGKLFRPDNPLLPNYKWVPIGYHGRASSIVASGAPIHRPSGQIKPAEATAPTFGPTRALDYELEVGFFIGVGNNLAEPIPLSQAEQHIFGLCLVNDWSARDIQSWEYQPLGPFLAKNFATTISPWIVTLDALEPFRIPAFSRPENDPAPLPYLHSPEDQSHGGFDITLEVWLRTSKMREPVRISRGNLRHLYWTPAQMLTHHAGNGCNLRPGDLLASGTVSGPTPDSLGCLLEITRRGAQPLTLPNGESRKFLEDGDEVTLRAYCEREAHARIGFGECNGIVVKETL